MVPPKRTEQQCNRRTFQVALHQSPVNQTSIAAKTVADQQRPVMIDAIRVVGEC